MSEYSFEGNLSQETGKEGVGANPELRPTSTRGKEASHGLCHDAPGAQLPHTSSVEIPSPIWGPERLAS